MSTVQLSFSLRVSSGVKTVHLAGTWDDYEGKLPLSKDKSSSKSGTWKGTFNFKNGTLQPGQRYWYYYIIDGCKVSHNPSADYTVEPTTNQKLNILDVPKSKSSSSSKSKSHKSSESRSSRPLSTHIQAPKPVSHAATHTILSSQFEQELNMLDNQFGNISLGNDYADVQYVNDLDSSSPTTSYLTDRTESPYSSMSGYSTPNSACSACSCERYGITRSGDRVRIDCYGSRCGYDCSDSESCYTSDCEGSDNRRHGIVLCQ